MWKGHLLAYSTYAFQPNSSTSQIIVNQVTMPFMYILVYYTKIHGQLFLQSIFAQTKKYKILVTFRYKLPGKVWMMQFCQGMNKVAYALCPEILQKLNSIHCTVCLKTVRQINMYFQGTYFIMSFTRENVIKQYS